MLLTLRILYAIIGAVVCLGVLCLMPFAWVADRIDTAILTLETRRSLGLTQPSRRGKMPMD